MNTNKIYANKQGEKWYDSFPLGNGHMGAMVINKAYCDKIVLNDECLWSGFPIDDANPNALIHLDEIRRLLFSGKRAEAQKLAEDNFLSVPPCLDSYEILTNLFTQYKPQGEVKNYSRMLNLETGVTKTEFTMNGEKYKSEIFLSGRDDIGVLHYETTAENGFSDFTLSQWRGCGFNNEPKVNDKGDFVISGQLGRDYLIEKTKEFVKERWMKYSLVLRCETDGTVDCSTGTLKVDNAKCITIYFASRTNFDFEKMNFTDEINGEAEAVKTLDAISGMTYDKLKKRAEKAFRERYNKVKLSISKSDNKKNDMYKLIKNAKNGICDTDFLELYYNYSRYILIASGELKSTLPANLQGIWCWEQQAPWNSDFHTNINLQMNYWQADCEGLDTAVEVLTDFMEKMARSGAKTAKTMYGARGWTIHHCTTPFGRTGLHDWLISGILPLAGAWMMMHMAEHYEYTQDLNYLKRIYPLMKGCCEFICDFLVKAPNGKYVTSPSASPENVFIMPEGGTSPLSYGCTIDLEIIAITLRNFLFMSDKLGIGDDVVSECKEKLDNLMPLQISKRYGGIQEWIEDYKEFEPGHRHISHLLGLFPGDMIQPSDKKLYKAAEKSLNRRVENGSIACNWSTIWGALFYSRFLSGDTAEKLLKTYCSGCLMGGLYNVFPDGEKMGMQVDSMLGFAAVINEMLIQSYEGTPDKRIIRLLPALPSSWQNGEIKGIRARGALTFDIAWKNNKLSYAAVTADKDTCVRIYSDCIKDCEISKEYTEKDGVITFDIKKGECVTITKTKLSENCGFRITER